MREIKQRVIGLDLLRQFGEHNRRIFTTEQFLQQAGQASIAKKDALAALIFLEAEEWVAILRRGTYVVIHAMPPYQAAHPFEIAANLVSPAAYSHWTAMCHHGLSQRPSPYLYVLTHTGPSLPRYRRKGAEHPKEIYPVGKTLFRFVQIQPSRYFGIVAVKDEGTSVNVTDFERTLWDAVAMPQLCGGWANIEACFYAARNHLNIERLISYAIKGDTATAKRLGWLLEYQGKSTDLLQPLLNLPIKGLRLLDASAPAGGFCNQRWMIRINTINP